jgi:Na+-transporting NADH:ubiquinone oxidoreductase subunit A
VQIHHIDPINKGELVWYLNPQDIVIIGRLFNQGKFDATRIIALTGSQIKNPQYFKTITGSAVKNMIAEGGLKDGENRIISGNVLTGNKISADGYLDFYDSQLTVIPEGHEYEFMGWLAPGFNKFSMSRAFFSWLTPNKKHELNSNLHGEERPFVITGEYEKVLPMDIYPVQLLKSILIEDVEMMEKLGIYEVVEEDFALCEFVCTSKIESQDIIRRGIDIIRKEFS